MSNNDADVMHEIIKGMDRMAKLCDDFDDIMPYIKAEIELKRRRAAFFSRMAEHFMGLVVIRCITKVGAVTISIVMPYIIVKMKEYSGGG